MRHPRHSSLLAVAIGLFFSASLHAQVMQYALTCNGCTQQQVESLLPDCTIGYQFVADFAANRLYLGCFREDGVVPAVRTHSAGPRRGSYEWVQPPASEQNTFQAYQNVYALNGHASQANARLSVDVSLPPEIRLGDDGYMNANDALRATQNMDAVKVWPKTTWFATSNTVGLDGSGIVLPKLGAALAQLLNNIKTSIISFDFKINVTIVFHDGSKISMTFDNQNGTWKYDKGSARDGHGNAIPDSYESIGDSASGSTYNFINPYPAYDQTNFLHTLQLNNIQPQGNPTQVLACVAVNGQVSCHYETVVQ